MKIQTLSLPALLAISACTTETSTAPPQPEGTATVVEASAPATPTAPPVSTEAREESESAKGLYALETSYLDGVPADLSEYRGQVALVVNVASQCGYTPQYAGLQELYEELGDQGFVVLGFPSNEFGGQEPGSPQTIQEFCSSRFGVTFPMFAKCEVKPGEGQSPVYSLLQEQTDEVPSWNFCKYLVGKDGQVIAFFPSGVAPDDAALRQAIEDALG